MRTLKTIIRNAPTHWVGDGFRVKSIFGYQDRPEERSPFLLLDYAAPHDFPGDGKRRGVGSHPHRGFETVTLAYQGEVEHRDSSGGGGKIGPGQVQWMTAGSGVVHEEFHSEHFSHQGGPFEMVQLWVNLRAHDKKHPPRYQTLTTFPLIPLAKEAGTVKVIAGSYEGHVGPAQTFTRINLWDLSLKANSKIKLTLPTMDTVAILVRRGELEGARAGDLLLWDRGGGLLKLSAESAVELLLMSGEPIAEPVVGYGPFVMNSKEEIAQSFELFKQGQFGAIA